MGRGRRAAREAGRLRAPQKSLPRQSLLRGFCAAGNVREGPSEPAEAFVLRSPAPQAGHGARLRHELSFAKETCACRGRAEDSRGRGLGEEVRPRGSFSMRRAGVEVAGTGLRDDLEAWFH